MTAEQFAQYVKQGKVKTVLIEKRSEQEEDPSGLNGWIIKNGTRIESTLIGPELILYKVEA